MFVLSENTYNLGRHEHSYSCRAGIYSSMSNTNAVIAVEQKYDASGVEDKYLHLCRKSALLLIRSRGPAEEMDAFLLNISTCVAGEHDTFVLV